MMTTTAAPMSNNIDNNIVEEREQAPSLPPRPPKTVCIDVRETGKKISVYPLVRVALEMKKLKDGDIVELYTDDYEGLRNDIRSWAELTGHGLELEEMVLLGEEYDHFFITKRSVTDSVVQQPVERLAIIISKDSLEDLISPLGFALAGAVAGKKVSIFFQGPAVHVLKKGFKGQLSGWFSKPFSYFARRGMAAMGHEPPTTKLQQLQDLGAKFFACHPSMDVFGVKQSQIAYDNVSLCEYSTFLLEMHGASTIQLYP